MDVRNVGESFEANESIDVVARPVHQVVTKVLPPGDVKDALHGVWLGHALHPLMTDVPIGFWTSSFVLDLIGGRKARPAADRLVGLGVLTALPTAAAGLADWSELFEPDRRTGMVHAAANVAATGLYGLSFLARRRGYRARGLLLGMAGAAVVTAGGFLGGHLSYRRAAGVSHVTSAAAPSEPTEVSGLGPDGQGQVRQAEVEGTPIVVVTSGDGVDALADHCSHLGGPLHEGEVLDGCIRCPWHGSTFRLSDGSVRRGPATAPQPAYELQTTDGRTEARRKPPR